MKKDNLYDDLLENEDMPEVTNNTYDDDDELNYDDVDPETNGDNKKDCLAITLDNKLSAQNVLK